MAVSSLVLWVVPAGDCLIVGVCGEPILAQREREEGAGDEPSSELAGEADEPAGLRD